MLLQILPYKVIYLCSVLLLISFSDVKAQLKTREQIDSLFYSYARLETQYPDSAILLYLDFARSAYYKKNQPYFVGTAYGIAGLVLTDLGKVRQSIPFFDSAYVYAAMANDYEGMSISRNNLGIAYQVLGNHDKAIESYLKAAAIAEKQKDTSSWVLGISNVGSMYFQLRQYDNAIKFQRKALQLGSNAIGKNIDKARLCVDFSLVFLQVGMLDSAIYYCNLSKQLYNYENPVTEITILLMEYRLYKMSNYPKAKAALTKATEMLEKEGALQGGVIYVKRVEVYSINADDAILNKNYALAEDYYLKCLVIAQESNSVGEMRYVYTSLRNLFELKNDFEKALYYARLSESYGDTVFNVEKEKLLQQHAFIYETEQSEQEILRKEIEVQQANSKIEKRNFWMVVALSVIVLLLITGYLFYRSLQLKKQLEQQETLFKERRRISSELHDDIGAKLSAASMFLEGVRNKSANQSHTELIEKTYGLVNTSINQLREVVQELQHTTLEEHGYVFATNELIDIMSNHDGLTIDFKHINMDERLDRTIEHNLFRITQELVNNTHKYARATNIVIELSKKDGEVNFHYSDNGKGFDLTNSSNGNGIRNIQNRVKTIDGELKIESSIGKGMNLWAKFIL